MKDSSDGTTLKVAHFALELNYVNVYLAFDEATRKAFMVDCGEFNDSIRNFVLDNKLELQFLLITHSHYDHVNGVAAFKKAFDIPVYAYRSNYDLKVAEGDEIAFGTKKIGVMETPGHIADGVTYYIQDAAFVGDAIFSGAVGGTANRAFFEEETQHVRNKILSLPDDTTIYPGHGAPTLVGVERLFNPFFR